MMLEKPTVLTLNVRFLPLFVLLVPPCSDNAWPAGSPRRALFVVPAANRMLAATKLLVSVPVP